MGVVEALGLDRNNAQRKRYISPLFDNDCSRLHA